MSKRSQHKGSIYQRADSRWAAAINLGWQNGQRHRKYLYGTTRGEVQEKLIKVLRDQQLGLPVAPERQTVGQFLDRWLEDSAKPSVRPKTFESYQQLVKLYLAPDLGRFGLSKLSPQAVQRFLNDRLASGLSARTVQYTHAVLRHALNQALRWGLVARNVATLVSPPQVRRPEIQPFSPEQTQVFLKAIEGDRLEALYAAAVAIGLRQGEAFGLRWPDLDLDAGTLAVRYSLQRIQGVPTFVEPKTPRSRRTINLPAVAIAALRRHQARQEQERIWAGSRWQEWGLVFCTTIGTPLDPPAVLKGFQKLLKAAGLPKLRFHDLRHTCATLLLAQGVHPRLVMDILGHSQISLTLNTYSHIMPVMQREVAAKMDEILSPVAVKMAVSAERQKPN
jgi:integrase